MTSAAVLGRGLRVLGRAVRHEPVMFAVAVAGSVLYSLLTIASARVVGAVVGRAVVPAFDSGRVGVAALAGGAAAIVGIGAGRVVGLFARRLGAGDMQFRLQARYRGAVVRRYLRLPLSWHHRHATGALLSNANADVESAWYPIAPLPFAVGTAVMLVAAVGSLLATDLVLGLVGSAVLPTLLAVNVGYSRRIAPRVTRAQHLRAEVSAVAHESFDGALVVKTLGGEAVETARFGARAGELRDAMIRVGRVRGLFDPLLDALPSLGSLAALLVGAVRLRQGAVGVADVVAVTYLFTVLAFPVRAIGWLLADLPRSVAGWDRVRRVLDAEGDVTYGPRTLPGAGPVTLRLAGVRFGYEDATDPAGGGPTAPADVEADADGRDVLHDVGFEVPAGRTVALVGPTGSGKSTIAGLVARLIDPGAGTVEIDGVDTRELTHDCLSATVGLVAQVPFVFDDTVRGNVALDRPGVDDDEVWRALRLAQLDGFVAGLADGLETMVGERGTSLSGGQRQRLTLARALAGRPRLLVLDDATSAVDPRVEAAILAGLREGDPAASILVVAYRRATIALADEVVYLERGRVLARGGHAELLATVPGYADLVTAYEREHDRGDEPEPEPEPERGGAAVRA